MASSTGLDRLVRKEVSLGAIREKQPPTNHIGLNYVPWMEVETDDVIFSYIKGGLQEGLAPARAEDAEAELAQKDEMAYGSGRAAVIDWSLKDKYTASDVTRYRDSLLLQQESQGTLANLNFDFVGRTVEDFQARLARHDALRRRKLDNRIEWLIMQGLFTGGISYNDGKIKFTVNYGRPGDQSATAPASGLWNTTTCDPIGDLLAVQDLHFTRYGTRPKRGIISQKAVNSLWKSSRFLAAVGVPVVGGTPSSPLDPNYLGLAGYNPQGALAVVSQATGIQFEIYDAVYQTRAVGSTTRVNNRFSDERDLLLLPDMQDLADINDTELGFGKTLTAPHPEGNWQPGYYEWEDETRDPWMHVRGTGVKAFPVLPYMEYTHTLRVLP